ncbi:MAG: MFS transporter [Chloroflexi bacterium]|nr:MAG: MFS transporter [Chloroflexota bacterium]
MTQPTNQGDKLDFKKIAPILVIVLVDLLGLTIIIPLLPLYATAFGANAFVIGVLGAAYPIMQFLGAPVLGRLSDRYGRKPVLVVSQIGTFIGFLMLGFANMLWLIFLSRIIDGISGANIATAQAAISDSTTEKNRTQGLGLIGAAFGLGFIIGPIIAFGALAVSNNNYQAPAFVAAAFSLASIILTTFWFEETYPKSARNEVKEKSPFNLNALIEAVKHPNVGFLLVLMFAQQLAFGGFEQILALFTLNRLGFNASGNAVVFVFVGIIIVAVQGGLIGKWSRRFGDRRLVYAGLALLTIGLTAVGFTPRTPPPWYSKSELEAELTQSNETPVGTTQAENLAVEIPDDTQTGWIGLVWMLIAMIPTSIGGGILRPTINSLITKRVESYEVGGTLGISSAFSSAANALAPLIGGALFQIVGATTTFVIWGMFLGVLFLLALQKIKPGREETAVSNLPHSSPTH